MLNGINSQWLVFFGLVSFVIVATLNVSVTGKKRKPILQVRNLKEESLVVEQIHKSLDRGEGKLVDKVVQEEPLVVEQPHKSLDFAEEKSVPSNGRILNIVVGDPHFKTWTGDKYDFHGVCDLVLLSCPSYGNGAGIHIHIRTKKIGSFSYVASAVVSVGDAVLEVEGGNKENLYWINKVAGEDLKTGDVFKFGEYNEYGDVQFTQDSKGRRFSIEMNDNLHLVIKTWNGFVSVGLDDPSKSINFEGSLGLMGSYPHGAKLSRDGKKEIDDLNDFGQEWQVTPSDGSFFHGAGDGPQFPQKCEIPSAVDMRRRLSKAATSKEDAEIACGSVGADSFDLCVFDVMVTDNKDFAGAY